MPTKGRLVHIARKKYGPRKDERSQGRAKLFQTLQSLVEPTALFKSDQNPHYPIDLKKVFPHATHQTHKGQRGSTTGQGGLKKTRFDPLFALNHTCAMTSANMNRLFRKTWWTSKNPGKTERSLRYLCGLPQPLSHLNSKNAHGGGAVLNLLAQPRSPRRRRFRRRQPSIFLHTNFSISARGWNASKSPFRGHEQF